MNIALAAAGGTLDDVVKVTVDLADVNDRQKVNEVRKEYDRCVSRGGDSPTRARSERRSRRPR
jgi:enamine deaminase RidA (YjgF/YER057c/UK114 family)